MQQYGPSFRQAGRHIVTEGFARKAAPLIAPHQSGQDDNNAGAETPAHPAAPDVVTVRMQTPRRQP
jgi:hypothetical protein